MRFFHPGLLLGVLPSALRQCLEPEKNSQRLLLQVIGDGMPSTKEMGKREKEGGKTETKTQRSAVTSRHLAETVSRSGGSPSQPPWRPRTVLSGS